MLTFTTLPMAKIYNFRVTKGLRSKLRNELLPPECILWRHLRDKQLGYRFRRQHGIGYFVVDFYCPSVHLVIEVDGAIHWIKRNMKRDKYRQSYLESLGLVVKRYTASQVLQEIEVVIEDIQLTCKLLDRSRRRTPS